MNQNRLLVLTVVVVFLITGLVARMFYVQVVKSDEIKFSARRQHIRAENITAERGLIMDRNMVVLAYSVPTKAFYVALRVAHRRATVGSIASRFAKVTGKDSSYYAGLMSATEGRVCIERVSGEIALELKKIKKDGLDCVEVPVRNYPYDNVAAHVIGYVEKNNFKGIDGIERIMDSTLRGEDGKRVILSDPMGNMVSVIEDATVAPRTGNSVVLTIDKNIQVMLEEELAKNSGTYAVGLLMDPNTGEILALANHQSYNLNNYGEFPEQVRRNHAIQDAFEPGSTFKAVAMAALLDQQLCREEEMVNVENGRYMFHGSPITDTHPFKTLSVKGVFTQSSNIGMSKLGQRISYEMFYKYLRALGIGIATNIALPAETEGSLSNPSVWGPSTRTSLSYGYAVTVSPLQMISAYAALINGGRLLQPQIVKRVQDAGNDILMDLQPRILRQAIAPAVSERMRKLMVAVIEEGTGKNAHIEGVEIGGKTGTAKIHVAGKGYSDGLYNASFIGFFPASSPKYLCLILVNNPSLDSYFGGSAAAPIFKRFAERIIAYDGNLKMQQKPLIQQQIASNANNMRKNSSQQAGKIVPSITIENKL
ncbi:MAG: penicillin-binding protein 2 [Ignavibacteriales bacterium]|nr:penicillin-binding protein 2 [Ignavibacteriales bacterium]